MKNERIIYHGSQKIIELPGYGLGKPYNDYGLGFYCTEHIELAKEWACSASQGGYANQYILDMNDLVVLDITEMNVLIWLAILLNNRKFMAKGALATEAKEYLLNRFLIDYSGYDVMIGYRADDSYFSFATGFLNNSLSLEQLTKAMQLGQLGQQVVLKSEKAFRQIQFQNYIEAKHDIYHEKRLSRDTFARADFQKMKTQKQVTESVYMIDILREGWKKDDICL